MCGGAHDATGVQPLDAAPSWRRGDDDKRALAVKAMHTSDERALGSRAARRRPAASHLIRQLGVVRGQVPRVGHDEVHRLGHRRGHGGPGDAVDLRLDRVRDGEVDEVALVVEEGVESAQAEDLRGGVEAEERGLVQERVRACMRMYAPSHPILLTTRTMVVHTMHDVKYFMNSTNTKPRTCSESHSVFVCVVGGGRHSA